MNAFDRYAPFIQDFIYSHDWESLRSIQVAAADAIFNTQDNVLLTASTASGKTEAAFFPILTSSGRTRPQAWAPSTLAPSRRSSTTNSSASTTCAKKPISPSGTGMAMSRNHTRPNSSKNRAASCTTPESLEALLIHKHMAIPRMFCDLRYVVIDEVHLLMPATAAGRRSRLIERLSRMAGVQPARLGLSATIGDPERTGAFLSQGTGRDSLSPALRNRAACGASPLGALLQLGSPGAAARIRERRPAGS